MTRMYQARTRLVSGVGFFFETWLSAWCAKKGYELMGAVFLSFST